VVSGVQVFFVRCGVGAWKGYVAMIPEEYGPAEVRWRLAKRSRGRYRCGWMMARMGWTTGRTVGKGSAQAGSGPSSRGPGESFRERRKKKNRQGYGHGRGREEADERWRVRYTGVIIKKIDSLREAAAGEMGRLISFAVGTRSFAPCQARGA
jgi:hypothetical protein